MGLRVSDRDIRRFCYDDGSGQNHAGRLFFLQALGII